MSTTNPLGWVQDIQKGKTVDPIELRTTIVSKLKEIYDPEIPINIYDLGLIYRVEVDEQGVVEVDMTLTTPACPVAQTFPGEVEYAVRNVRGVTAAIVELVWDPPWSPEVLTMEAKLELGLL